MKVAEFQQLVWEFYGEHGRAGLPWRKTTDPYAIYISEMMLQQTQATRVIPKYETWLENFPTFESVAAAKKADILKHWQGLGYNRRALFVKKTCETVADEFEGELPENEATLLALPGVGPYTAGALQAFIFEKPVVFVETNIRTVFIHHFFADEEDVSDTAIKEKVQETLPAERIREWYWALMDYGNFLKKEVGNLNSRAKNYQTQSKFAGSNRQLRAQITRFILAQEPTTREAITTEFEELARENERMNSPEEIVTTLAAEGFITTAGSTIKTAD